MPFPAPAEMPPAVMSAAPPAPPKITLDPGALARLRELDPDSRHGVLRRVLAAFETSLSRMLAQLSVQLQDGDAEIVKGVAHTLKSSSASVGALALAQACAEVERRLRDGDTAGLHADVERLVAAGEAALAAVAAMLRS
jgi:HPt (histidine-containing phosphotransfer) domain-containing protein